MANHRKTSATGSETTAAASPTPTINTGYYPLQKPARATIRRPSPNVLTISVPARRRGVFEMGRRTTVLRLPSSGSLLVYCPADIDDEVRAAVATLGGPVRYLLCGNNNVSHDLSIPAWLENFPDAAVIAPAVDEQLSLQGRRGKKTKKTEGGAKSRCPDFNVRHRIGPLPPPPPPPPSQPQSSLSEPNASSQEDDEKVTAGCSSATDGSGEEKTVAVVAIADGETLPTLAAPLPQDVTADLDFEYVRGSARAEIAVFHRRDKALLLADLLWTLPSWEAYSRVADRRADGGITGVLSRCIGWDDNRHGRLAMAARRLLLRHVLVDGGKKGDEDFADSIDRIHNEWDFERLVVCHGSVVEKEGEAKRIFSVAFRWPLEDARKRREESSKTDSK